MLYHQQQAPARIQLKRNTRYNTTLLWRIKKIASYRKRVKMITIVLKRKETAERITENFLEAGVITPVTRSHNISLLLTLCDCDLILMLIESHICRENAIALEKRAIV